MLLVTGQLTTSNIGTLGPNGLQIVDGIPGGLQPGARVSGRVFIDFNDDSIFDDDEPRSNGQTVQLVDEAGNIVASTPAHARDINRNGLVDASEAGFYAFNNIPSGNYSVIVLPPTGWHITTQDVQITPTQTEQFEGRDHGIRITAPWHNLKNPLDVNRDNIVSPIDVLLIINYLNSDAPAAVPQSQTTRIPCRHFRRQLHLTHRCAAGHQPSEFNWQRRR